jgi:hypothetical protein
MHFKSFALILGLAASANAQVSYKLPAALGNIAPISLPGRPVVPMILPSVDATLAAPSLKPALTPVVVTVIAPISLPVYPAPAIGPARLPGVPSPLPLPTPAALASARRPAPSAEEPIVLDWSLLNRKDGDEPAAALVPNDPGPRPLSPAGALNAVLRELKPGELFDGRRKPSQRELELPYNRYF